MALDCRLNSKQRAESASGAIVAWWPVMLARSSLIRLVCLYLWRSEQLQFKPDSIAASWRQLLTCSLTVGFKFPRRCFTVYTQSVITRLVFCGFAARACTNPRTIGFIALFNYVPVASPLRAALKSRHVFYWYWYEINRSMFVKGLGRSRLFAALRQKITHAAPTFFVCILIHTLNSAFTADIYSWT